MSSWKQGSITFLRNTLRNYHFVLRHDEEAEAGPRRGAVAGLGVSGGDENIARLGEYWQGVAKCLAAF
ncbi:hypothetical protein E2C01_036411 [Portunus trituberculatus]|uniref:Uncharacterized protein n=1 Tax=Portunus trituberculatus TaxID=210409 RepID=A0A5B7F5N9_PORTR|nr:hypothetical protein [Portunus trituberculatus]